MTRYDRVDNASKWCGNCQGTGKVLSEGPDELTRLREELDHERRTNEKLATSNGRLRAEKMMLREALDALESFHGCSHPAGHLERCGGCEGCDAQRVLEETK